jgi:hypothetical protein
MPTQTCCSPFDRDHGDDPIVQHVDPVPFAQTPF